MYLITSGSAVSILPGYPPKVIWVRSGNCSTNQIEEILQLHLEDIQAFAENSDLGVLTLY
ncbi:DUF5615 family PIN-like protein [Dolichospermum circinale]|uniref:DUF5615 family PIN-like protein n=1 Tax=Dolichospermum circinale TaxID=109265 RepID=UPI0012DCF066|nr:DUF5615 family PIN-like protein [Dolichospermum circinale]MDB9476899.1 hypothetical protein [Dolichospermum circinale CS-537/11]MDB9477383.1 hypothetical protein [Dolichospermum circinale CS-537/03]MDB9483072.1 hypothetical protein [Dolichospermum circinale CS-537/05]